MTLNEADSTSGPSWSLVDALLDEQQQLTAVDRFAQAHAAVESLTQAPPSA